MLSLCQELTQRQVPVLKGGITESIFPLVEVALQDKRLRNALFHAVSKDDMSKYRSVIDFFFCELFPLWRKSCFRFYEDNGEPLRKLLSEDKRAAYEDAMLAALDTLGMLYRAHQVLGWDYCVAETAPFALLA